MYLKTLFRESKPHELCKLTKENCGDVDISTYYKSISRRGTWVACKEQRNALEEDIWIKSYFNDEYCYKQGQRKLVEKVGKIYTICAQKVQELIVKKIINKEIVIEANPSSNRKISHIGSNSDLPVVQIINKFSLLNSWNNVCINTDDSAIFQTNLNNEYMILYNYYKDKNGKKMIEELAKNSLEISFVGRK